MCEVDWNFYYCISNKRSEPSRWELIGRKLGRIAGERDNFGSGCSYSDFRFVPTLVDMVANSFKTNGCNIIRETTNQSLSPNLFCYIPHKQEYSQRRKVQDIIIVMAMKGLFSLLCNFVE